MFLVPNYHGEKQRSYPENAGPKSQLLTVHSIIPLVIRRDRSLLNRAMPQSLRTNGASRVEWYGVRWFAKVSVLLAVEERFDLEASR